MPTTQLYRVSSSLEEWDKGTLVDVPASDLEAILILISFWKTSKGTPGTSNVCCSFVVFPPLLLLLSALLPLRLLLWYSSISLSLLFLDEDTMISNILKSWRKPKDEKKRIFGSKRGWLKMETPRWGVDNQSQRRKYRKCETVGEEFHYL